VIPCLLIKWCHASYLHASWERIEDLISNGVSNAKLEIEKFLKREENGKVCINLLLLNL